MTSNRDIEKLFEQWNPNNIRAGDRVQVNNSIKYIARVVGLELDIKNKKVFAFLKLADVTKNYPIRVDVRDCFRNLAVYPSHHEGY